jgi:hypothetical protein
LYGIAWSHPNAGGAAANLASHGMLILEDGNFKGAWGGGSLRTPSDVRGTVFYDYDNTAYYLNPNGSSYLYEATMANTIYSYGWFRSYGSTGWYNETYGGGIYMIDTTWVRTYASKNFYCDSYIRAQGSFRVGSEYSVWSMINGQSAYISRIGYISFNWTDTGTAYDSYNYHGISSTDLNGSLADSVSINSFNDINLRVDSNNNNGASYIRMHNNSDASNQFAYIGYDGTNYLSYFTGTGYFTGDVIAYYSDARLKENIKPIDSVLEKISKIGGYYYTPNALALQLNAASDNNQKLGVLAQEIQEVFPEAVEKAPFDRDENGNSKSGEDYLTVKYERLVPVLIEAIKEQQRQIEELKYLIKNK